MATTQELALNDRLSHPGITRRHFMVGAGALGATGVVFSNPLVSIFTQDESTRKELSETISPGWIEAKIQPPFVQVDKGHFHFLREAVLTNPMLHELTTDFFSYLRQNKEMGNKLGLGDTLGYVLLKTQERFKFLDKNQISAKSELGIEILHAASFVFAAGFMPWFSEKDLRSFGVTLKEGQKVGDYFMDNKDGVVMNVMPGLFLKKELSEGGQGRDRVIHFAQHFFLGSEYLYAGLTGSSFINPQLKLLVIKNGSDNLVKNAREFSEWMGVGWEYSNLTDLRNWPPNANIAEGPFDPMVNADYKANELGVNTAIGLFRCSYNGESIDMIIEKSKRLNNKMYEKFEAKPTVNF